MYNKRICILQRIYIYIYVYLYVESIRILYTYSSISYSSLLFPMSKINEKLKVFDEVK